MHLNKSIVDRKQDLEKLFYGHTIFIDSNYNSDIVFLSYIINNWDNMPPYLIYLRDINWVEKKSIIAYLNKLDLIWGNMKYMNLDHYIQYVLKMNTKDLIGDNVNMIGKVNNSIMRQSNSVYIPFDYNLLQRGSFKIFWDVYMLPYFGEIQKNIGKIININKQKTTGQFIVDYRQFYYRPKEFYINLLTYLKKGNTNYIPVLWDVILS